MSTTQPTLSLKELAREYAEGRIDRETFRQRRARLLDELAAYSPPAQRQPSVHAENPHREQRHPREQAPKRGRFFIGLSAIVVLLIIIGSIIFMVTENHEDALEYPPLSSTTPSESPAHRDAVTSTVPESVRPIEDDPIKDFVTTNDWGPESRQALILQWNKLPQASKDAFSATSWFLSFSSELRTMIKEERGLAGGQASEAVKSLIEFAARLGLDFSADGQGAEAVPPPYPVKIPSASAPLKESKAVDSKIAPSTATKPLPDDANQVAANNMLESTASTEVKLDTESLDNDEVVAHKSTAPVVPAPLPKKLTPAERTSKAIPAEQNKSEQMPATPENQNCRPLAGSRKILKCRDQLKSGKKGPRLQLLPGGLFTMGRDEVKFASPPHQVNIAYPFAIGTYEVSYREFSLYCKATGIPCPPQPWQDDTLPVVNVSRDQAKQYAEWLSMQTGRGYRLPTEAEWEYAARAGSVTAYPLPESDLHTYAHFSDRSREQTPLPRSPQRTNPNQFGIYNMAGNVREWVLDSWTEDYKAAPRDGSPYQHKKAPNGIVRGGSYADNHLPLHSSARQPLPHNTQDVYTGFRLVRDVYLKTGQEDLTR